MHLNYIKQPVRSHLVPASEIDIIRYAVQCKNLGILLIQHLRMIYYELFS